MPRNSRSPYIYKELLIRIQQGDYMAAITVGSYVDDNCQQILDLFYAL